VSSIDVKALFEEIIEDHRYLLTGRECVLAVNLNGKYLDLEREPLSVILSNVMRNAFQYGQGNIEITIDNDRIQIRNEKAEASTQKHESFGVGLELTRRLCEKLNWQFHYIDKDGCVSVTIVFDTLSITSP